MISIAYKDNVKDILAFQKKEPMPWVNLLDDGLFKKWGGRGVPTTILVDKKGVVIDIRLGSLTFDKLEKYKDKLFVKSTEESK